jgi:hypothetical protein
MESFVTLREGRLKQNGEEDLCKSMNPPLLAPILVLLQDSSHALQLSIRLFLSSSLTESRSSLLHYTLRSPHSKGLNGSSHVLDTRFRSSTYAIAKTLFWTFRSSAFGGELRYEANKQKNSILSRSRTLR